MYARSSARITTKSNELSLINVGVDFYFGGFQMPVNTHERMTTSSILGSTFVAATSFMALKSAQMISKPVSEAATTIKTAAEKMARTANGNGGGNTSGNFTDNSSQNKVYGLPTNSQNSVPKSGNQVK